MRRISVTLAVYTVYLCEEQCATLPSIRRDKRGRDVYPTRKVLSEKLTESDDEEDLEDDADFMRKWRKSRLQ